MINAEIPPDPASGDTRRSWRIEQMTRFFNFLMICSGRAGLEADFCVPSSNPPTSGVLGHEREAWPRIAAK